MVPESTEGRLVWKVARGERVREEEEDEEEEEEEYSNWLFSVTSCDRSQWIKIH